jgi:peptide/nickel transport system ATP-binding protein
MTSELLEVAATVSATAPATAPAGTAANPVPARLLSVDGLHVSVGGGGASRGQRSGDHRGGVEAVTDVSFTVGAGESVGIVGESGSGKTLVCRSVLGVLPQGCAITSGQIDFDEDELTSLSPRGWRRVRGHKLGAVFQDPASYLNPSITVGRQLSEQVRLTQTTSRGGLGRRDARAATIALLTSVGLRSPGTVYDRFPHELSGGMLQRVLIAIAIAGSPKLLVADEATTALDVAVQAEVLELLAALRTQYGLALLLVSHDLAVVAEVCDRVIVLYAGEVVEAGPTAEVVARPKHPYTEALLRVASLGNWERRELDVIPGRSPVPGEALAGCRFADRCAYVTEECRAARVELTTATDRQVRCVRADVLGLVGVAS